MRTVRKKPAPKHLATRSQEKAYPFVVRLYGWMSVVAGGLQTFLLVLVGMFVLALLGGGTSLDDLETVESISLTTLSVSVVNAIASAALSVMFFILGIRLLKNKHHAAALLCNVMIALEAVVLVCQFMLRGLHGEIASPLINMVILFVLEVYSDPSLRVERQARLLKQELDDKAAAEAGTLGRDPSGRGYLTLNFFNVFWVFCICSVLGLVLEIAWHMLIIDPGVYQDRAGMLYGPFSPIYGFGAVLMTVALNRYYRSNPVVVFLVAGLIGAAFEFFVSWFMEVAFGIVAWDYTGTFLNVCGRTNFKFFCMWGALGLAWVRWLLPLMLKTVNRIPWNWRYGFTTVCAVFMLVDGWLTLASFDCWYQRASGDMDYAHASAVVAFCNEHYDDAYMEGRFQTMTLTPENASRA